MKLSEKKKSVAGKMKPWTDYAAPKKLSGKTYTLRKGLNRALRAEKALTPVKHKVDVAGQESYKEEDK